MRLRWPRVVAAFLLTLLTATRSTSAQSDSVASRVTLERWRWGFASKGLSVKVQYTFRY